MHPHRIHTTCSTAIALLALSFNVSASTAIVLPGLHESGYDLNGNVISAEDVINWELSNTDIVFGEFNDPANNARASTLGYMYNQILDFGMQPRENAIRNAAQAQGIDYEDLFLHFSEDTVLGETDPYHGSNTILNRKPLLVGYTASSDHSGFWLYQTPNWDADVFKDTANGGALYIYHSEPFDRLHFNFSQFAGGGTFSIEYPSQVDADGQVTQWQAFNIHKDKTKGFTRNKAVIWKMPSNWIRATTSNGSGWTYGGGQFFGSEFIRDGGRLFVVRVSWDSNHIPTRPRLANVRLKNSFKVVTPDATAPTTDINGRPIVQWRQIRGFDRSADVNNDNYLSGQEYKQRANKAATARFRWESRVIPFGSMWSSTSAWGLTNLQHPDFISLMNQHYLAQWSQRGLSGAYNDDTNKLIGNNQFTVHSGGLVTELGLVAGSALADSAYQAHFSTFLSQIPNNVSGALVGLNVGTANLYGRNGQNHLTQAGNVYLREHYLYPSTGFSGYAGLSKYWDNSALAASGKKVIFQATTRYGRVQYFGNTQANWQHDQYSTLAQFYLNYHAQSSLFNQWNNGFVYGSDNTTLSNYWLEDIPKNIAYRPSQLLDIDLGVPANSAPANATLIPLMLSTSTPYNNDYTIVGDSASLQAIHPDLPYSAVNVIPTHTYFAYRSANNVIPGAPVDMVLARDYTKGRVLFRTDFSGKSQAFFNSAPVTLPLNVPMRPVDENGNIGPYTTQVQIGGYQALFLLY